MISDNRYCVFYKKKRKKNYSKFNYFQKNIEKNIQFEIQREKH